MSSKFTQAKREQEDFPSGNVTDPYGRRCCPFSESNAAIQYVLDKAENEKVDTKHSSRCGLVGASAPSSFALDYMFRNYL